MPTRCRSARRAVTRATSSAAASGVPPGVAQPSKRSGGSPFSSAWTTASSRGQGGVFEGTETLVCEIAFLIFVVGGKLAHDEHELALDVFQRVNRRVRGIAGLGGAEGDVEFI